MSSRLALTMETTTISVVFFLSDHICSCYVRRLTCIPSTIIGKVLSLDWSKNQKNSSPNNPYGILDYLFSFVFMLNTNFWAKLLG